MSTIQIWNPKYSTREVLVSTKKIKDWINIIEITKDKDYAGKILKVHSDVARACRKQQNWAILVYCIPLSSFEIVEK